MKIEDIRNIAVIGAGNMGHQISTLCAMHGFKTKCTDIDKNTLQKAEAFVDAYLPGRVEKGKLSEAEANQARENLTFTQSLEEAVQDADYVIETIIEVFEIKRKVFPELDKIAPPHAILGTNSSRIVSSRVAETTERPGKVVNFHFFNPALVMKLVEVVQGPHTTDETARISLELAEKLGKIPIHVKKEIEGFIVNRVLRAINREVLWMLEMGIASLEDIDKGCVYGLGHPMGPFRLMDLTGIDINYLLGMEEFKNGGERSLLPVPSVVERYFKGEHGKKTGKGWYDYSNS